MNKFISLLLVVAFALPLLGAAQADSERNARGRTFEMCSTETAASGVCQNTASTPNDIYAIVDRYSDFTFYFSETGTPGATCDIYATDQISYPTFSNAQDLDALTTVLKINSTSLSATADKISFSGSFYYMWVSCTLNGATNYTVTMQASEGLERQ